MYSEPYELIHSAAGVTARISARGTAVLAIPTINRGTAFSREEREALGLTGLLPTAVTTLDGQLRRVYAQYRSQVDDLRKNVYLANLRDRNEVLFYRLLAEHISEMLPIVYTPTVGLAIERFSDEFRRARGVYLSVDDPANVETAFLNTGKASDDVDIVVATDSEGILGIGDQGVGGIEIAIGKLAVYTAAAGIHPHRVLPVVLDTGTDNPKLLDDEMYLGVRHGRVRDQRYDDLVESFVSTVTKRYPHALLHWEDFAAGNAHRLLTRYADRACTFNDDMQGTAAVVQAAVLTAVRATGGRMRDQRIVIHGAGTAGLSVADMLRDVMVGEGLSPAEATRRFHALGSRGLLVDDSSRLRDFQVPYARPARDVTGWVGRATGSIGLEEVVSRVQPTILLGTSAQAGAFSERIVRDMAAHTDRPVILPLSNPTSQAEAHPSDLVDWTEGRALIASGSPFPPVTRDGVTFTIAQANNALVFPGLGLGVKVARARRVTGSMIAAAAGAVAGLSDASSPGAPLLPPVDDLRRVSETVAAAVVAAAVAAGVARADVADPLEAVRAAAWHPAYPVIEAV